jgi:hypothetical protein
MNVPSSGFHLPKDVSFLAEKIDPSSTGSKKFPFEIVLDVVPQFPV